MIGKKEVFCWSVLLVQILLASIRSKTKRSTFLKEKFIVICRSGFFKTYNWNNTNITPKSCLKCWIYKSFNQSIDWGSANPFTLPDLISCFQRKSFQLRPTQTIDETTAENVCTDEKIFTVHKFIHSSVEIFAFAACVFNSMSSWDVFSFI